MATQRPRASPTHDLLVELVGGYLNTLMARSVVAVAAGACRVDAGVLAPRHLPAIGPEVLTACKALCEPARFEELRGAVEAFMTEQLSLGDTWDRLLDPSR